MLRRKAPLEFAAGRKSQGRNIFLCLALSGSWCFSAFWRCSTLRLGPSVTPSAEDSVTPRTFYPVAVDHNRACHPSTFFVAVKSGGSSVQYRDRRQRWRQESTCPRNYYRNNYKLFVGLPLFHTIDPSSHNQGARDTDEERQLLASVQAEQKLYNDTIVLPLRDVYDDFFLKTIHMFQWLDQNAPGDIVVLHDDEFCANLTVVQHMCETAVVHQASLYGGEYLWDKPIYDIQQPEKGRVFAPYFSGNMYVMSMDLVRSIVHHPDTVYAGLYASHSEDLQVGRFVQAAQETMNVVRLTDPMVMYSA